MRATRMLFLAMVACHLRAEKVYATELDADQVKFAQKVWDLNNAPVVLVEEDLPQVDICVANIGDQLWDIRHQINAEIFINVSNVGELVVVNA